MVYPMLFPGIILLNYGALGVGFGVWGVRAWGVRANSRQQTTNNNDKITFFVYQLTNK